MAKIFNGIRIILLIFACLIISSAAGPFSAPQKKKQTSAPKEAPQKDESTEPENFKIAVDVNLVTTDVGIIGNPVSELKAEDFVIYDDGVAQEVTYFSQDQLPLAVALVIDASESIKDYLPMLQIAGYSTLRRFKADDQITLFSFNEDRIRLSDLTEDRFEIAEKITKIKIAYGTNVYDAIYDNATFLSAKAPRRRHAIILVSDNCQYGQYYRGAGKCLTELLESGALLYSIRTPGDTPGGDGMCMESEAEVQKMAELTGGEVLDVNSPLGLQSALEKVVSNLRKQFTLGFNPSVPGEKGKYHKLIVKLADEKRCPGCRLISRSGYYSRTATPSASTAEKKDKKAPVRDPEQTDQLLIKQSMIAAGALNMDILAIPFDAKTSQQLNSKGQPEFKIDLTISADAINFKTVDKRHACKIRAAFFSANEDGKIFNSDWRVLEGYMSDETYSRVMRTGISYTVTVPAKLKNQILKIVLYDEENDRIGTKIVMLQQRM
jgi:Ca-activated chloride channel homolog